MTLDDTIRGVRDYVVKIGFPEKRFSEVRMVYYTSRLYYERQNPVTVSFDRGGILYQQAVLQQIKAAELFAANKAREYAKKEVERK